MNNLIKERMREKKEQIRSLNLKKDNFKDKIEMQNNFIKEIKEQSKNTIDLNKNKVNVLIKESDDYLLANTDKENIVSGLIKDQEKTDRIRRKISKA